MHGPVFCLKIIEETIPIPQQKFKAILAFLLVNFSQIVSNLVKKRRKSKMEIAANSLATSSISLPTWSSSSLNRDRISFASFKTIGDIHVTSSISTPPSRLAVSNAVGNEHNQRSSLESLFCYDKSVPEEVIEKPIGVSLSEKNIGGNPRCPHCLTRGAVLCATCSGSGLYVDSILESQGIIVKVRCLGCGGSGNILCSGCGGRGHLG